MTDVLPLKAEIVVMGGGPAGIAAAITLAHAGRQVAVIERSGYDNVRIGETLPPRTRVLLGALGLPADLGRDGHIEAPGIVAVWGDAEPLCNDFVMNPYGNGWHVDRKYFDGMLAARARNCGIAVCERSKVIACEQVAEGWHVVTENALERVVTACRFVVDATGRRASPIKRRAGQRIIVDQLVGIAAFMPCTPSTDRRTLIESTVNGWWYSAPLPHGGQVSVYMTDADAIDTPRVGLVSFLERQLRHAPHTRARCDDLLNDAHVIPYAAMTYHHSRLQGRNWLLAGDSAMAWDPLSGHGVCKALDSGIGAGVAIDRALQGDDRALADYELLAHARFSDYLGRRARYYRSEQRWPDSAFWRCRHLLN